MEIERKFLIKELPADLASFPCHKIEQAYLNTNPVVRIRRQDDAYFLTYKGEGHMVREEYNLPLNETSYCHLKEKADGIILTKTRYLLPLEGGLTIELDVFGAPYEGLFLAEVEFPDVESANSFTPPPLVRRGCNLLIRIPQQHALRRKGQTAVMQACPFL